MTTRLGYAPGVTVQALAAGRWWRKNRPTAPRLFRDEVSAAIDLLANSPRSGAPFDDARIVGVRRLLLPRTRYHVYYAYNVQTDELTVLAIWSAVRGRRPPLVLL